jgi:hypothetical protein
VVKPADAVDGLLVVGGHDFDARALERAARPRKLAKGCVTKGTDVSVPFRAAADAFCSRCRVAADDAAWPGALRPSPRDLEGVAGGRSL